MEAKHTPGPWAVIESASGKPLVIADHPQHDGDIAKCQDAPVGRANARLIAAAPDLLEALRNITQSVRHMKGFELVVADCDAAIARATAA